MAKEEPTLSADEAGKRWYTRPWALVAQALAALIALVGAAYTAGHFLHTTLATEELTEARRDELRRWAQETARDGVSSEAERAALAQFVSEHQLRTVEVDDFLADLQEAVEHSADLVREGAALAQRGGFEEACERFLVATSRNPENVQAWVNLGAAKLELEKRHEAEKALRRAVELDPDRWTAHYNLGATLASAGRLEQAIRHLELSMDLAESTGLTEAEKRSLRGDLAANRWLEPLRTLPRFEALLQHAALEPPRI